jgi:hypothetical protein
MMFLCGLSVSVNTSYKKTISNDIIKPLSQFYYNLKTASYKNLIDEEIEKIKNML